MFENDIDQSIHTIKNTATNKMKFTIHLSLFTITIHCHYSSVTIYDTVHSEFLPI